jgi:hypothetical protein
LLRKQSGLARTASEFERSGSGKMSNSRASVSDPNPGKAAARSFSWHSALAVLPRAHSATITQA